MQEGFTTATEEMRAMGFGSGMGLPNIKRNTDELVIHSEVNKGTQLMMRFFIIAPNLEVLEPGARERGAILSRSQD
jgi:anti-sigma regulatory factor (Ser/Thr protein kinase)